VDDRPPGSPEALVGALDQLAAALGQDLDGDVAGDQVLFDQLSDEVVVGLRGGRKADLDLLEAHSDQRPEHLQLPAWVHRIDEGLVAVAKVDRAPDRRLPNLPVGPLAVRDAER